MKTFATFGGHEPSDRLGRMNELVLTVLLPALAGDCRARMFIDFMARAVDDGICRLMLRGLTPLKVLKNCAACWAVAGRAHASARVRMIPA